MSDGPGSAYVGVPRLTSSILCQGERVAETGTLHHLELRVDGLDVAGSEWGWPLGQLGYACTDRWRHGRSWKHGSAGYVVLEAGRIADPVDTTVSVRG